MGLGTKTRQKKKTCKLQGNYIFRKVNGENLTVQLDIFELKN